MATSLPPIKTADDKKAAAAAAKQHATAMLLPRIKSVVATRREIAEGVMETIEAAREGPNSWAYEQLMFKMKAREIMKRQRNRDAAKGQSFLQENADQVRKIARIVHAYTHRPCRPTLVTSQLIVYVCFSFEKKTSQFLLFKLTPTVGRGPALPRHETAPARA
jgi:hypothetical protein